MAKPLVQLSQTPEFSEIQDTQSAVQMEDIKNLVAIDHLDWEYISKWINKLNLRTFELLNR